MHTNRKDKAPLHRCGTHQCNQVNFFHSKVSAFSIFFFQKRALNLILKTGFKLEDGGNAVRNATNFSVNAPVETASLEWFWPMQKLQWSALFGLSVQGFQPVCASNPQNNNNYTRKKKKTLKTAKAICLLLRRCANEAKQKQRNRDVLASLVASIMKIYSSLIYFLSASLVELSPFLFCCCSARSRLSFDVC